MTMRDKRSGEEGTRRMDSREDNASFSERMGPVRRVRSLIGCVLLVLGNREQAEYCTLDGNCITPRYLLLQRQSSDFFEKRELVYLIILSKEHVLSND